MALVHLFILVSQIIIGTWRQADGWHARVQEFVWTCWTHQARYLFSIIVCLF